MIDGLMIEVSMHISGNAVEAIWCLMSIDAEWAYGADLCNN